MYKKLIYLNLFFWLSPLSVFAQSTNYLEFNPDYFKTKSLNVSSSGVLYEIFLPSNEFFGGADFWFDNSGSAGTATFELRDENNNFLTSKSVTIPHINPVQGGQRVHFDWNSQIPVIGNNKYRIRISSSLPQLQIYYADRIKFLGHNEPHISDYINGAAEINGEEQQFSFKYALYEIVETSPPIISDVSWTVVSENQMRVNFNANEPVDFKLEYGLDGQGYTNSVNWTNEYQFCAEGVSECGTIILVSPDSTYQYLLSVRDSWGNQSQFSGSFVSGQSQIPTPTPSNTPASSVSPGPSPSNSQTPPPSSPSPTIDPTLPAISNLRVVDLTDTSVGIAWTTNEAANSHLLISTPFLITVTDASDPTMELEHFLEINNGLGFSTTYVATITSIDSGSNSVQASLSFTTLPQIIPTGSPTPLPQPTPGQTTTSSYEGETIITWSSGNGEEPSEGYRIDIFDKEGNLIRTINVPSGSHDLNVGDLNEGEYSVIVYANNDGVYEKISQPTNLKVEEPSFIKRLMGFWWALIPLIAGLGYMFWKNSKNKASQKIGQVVP